MKLYNVHRGLFYLRSTFSYINDQPYIFFSSVKENIILHKPFDIELYNKVKKICLLDDDIANLADKDDTNCGFKKLKFSNCFKVRITIARAIYNGHELYLFDNAVI